MKHDGCPNDVAYCQQCIDNHFETYKWCTVECERVNCNRPIRYIVQVIGYDIGVCWYHKFIHPISQIWANIQIKINLWKWDKVPYSLWVDVFPRGKNR